MARALSSRLSVSSSAVPFADAETDNTDTGAASFGKFSNGCDPHEIRRKHPERWRGFLRAHYPDVTAVKYAFSVDYNTAKHWWNGTNAPQGWAVEYALKAVPGAVEWLAA